MRVIDKISFDDLYDAAGPSHHNNHYLSTKTARRIDASTYRPRINFA